MDSVIDKLDLNKFYSSYKGGGTTSHNPKMLLKALIYAYINNIYSSRKIEEAIRSNIYFVWLYGSCEPDHNTVNRFSQKKQRRYLKIFSTNSIIVSTGGTCEP